MATQVAALLERNFPYVPFIGIFLVTAVWSSCE